MTARRMHYLPVLIATLAVLGLPTATALAGAPCDSNVTVQSGDTLASLAAACGTTADAIRAANPGLGNSVQPGQVIYVPSAYAGLASNQTGGTYTTQAGDTVGGVALAYGVTPADVLAVNPGLSGSSSLTAGQIINLPVGVTFAPYGVTAVVTQLGSPLPSIGGAASTSSSGYSNLMVTYGHGVLVRTGPGINYPEIKSPWVSAVKFSHWVYRKNSLTTDSMNFVWVEVKLSPLVSGYTTGWILVRDSLGVYFTSPNLGPRLDLRFDP